jgi:hypothetical protein
MGKALSFNGEKGHGTVGVKQGGGGGTRAAFEENLSNKHTLKPTC